MREKLVIFGNGQLALNLIPELRREAEGDLVGVIADERYIRERELLGLPVTPASTAADLYPPSTHSMMVLIGYSRMRDRAVTLERAKKMGYRLFTFVSPSACFYEDLQVGENSYISPLVHLGPRCRVGTNTIVRPNAYVGHDVAIGDHCYLGPQVAVGGGTTIGDLCFLGIGATVVDGTRIADETLLAAGAVLNRSTEPCSQYAGNPASKCGEHRQTGILFFR